MQEHSLSNEGCCSVALLLFFCCNIFNVKGQEDIIARADNIRKALKKTPIRAKGKADEGELVLVCDNAQLM